jgi:hypothetical protein
VKERKSIMKKYFVSSFWFCLGLAAVLWVAIVPVPLMGQTSVPIVGTWEGTLDPGAQPKKRIVVHISAAQDGSLSGTIDYPDENASGAQITAITYNPPALHFESSASLALFDGAVSKDNSEIDGVWKQGATPSKLILKRTS